MKPIIWEANESRYADGMIGVGPVNQSSDAARAWTRNNAALISAAPELLERLKQRMKQCPHKRVTVVHVGIEDCAECQTDMKLIAKAEKFIDMAMPDGAA